MGEGVVFPIYYNITWGGQLHLLCGGRIPVLIFVQRTLTCFVIYIFLQQLHILSRIMYNFPDLLQY